MSADLIDTSTAESSWSNKVAAPNRPVELRSESSVILFIPFALHDRYQAVGELLSLDRLHSFMKTPLTDQQLRMAMELLFENIKLTALVVDTQRDLLEQMEKRGLFEPQSALGALSSLEQLQAYVERVKTTLPQMRKIFGLDETA